MADRSKFIRNKDKFYRQICFSNTLENDGKVYGLSYDGDIQIAKLIPIENSGGGGAGTSNYVELTNKPQINSIELVGNKTLEDLGIQAKGNYATVNQLNEKANTSDLANYATKEELSTSLSSKADTSAIPTKTSQLSNDSGFITSIPSEYVTDEELEAKNYLTEIPNTVQLKQDDTLSTSNKTVVGAINELKTQIDSSSGGGTGTSNYVELTNKPQINSIELIGNKTLEDLGIQPAGDYATTTQLAEKADASAIPTKVSQLTNDSNYLTTIPSEYVTETELESKNYLTAIPDTVQLKQDNTLSTTDKTVVGAINELKTQIDSSGGAGTTNYVELTNKPQINSIELTGNKSLSDLGIQPAGDYATATQLAEKADVSAIPTNTSQLNNDSGFITSIPNTVQLKQDDTLSTSNKTVVGAINELLTLVNSLQTQVGNVSTTLDNINGEVV